MTSSYDNDACAAEQLLVLFVEIRANSADET
jgi:hypothetical protein